jgi:hypothetical protein
VERKTREMVLWIVMRARRLYSLSGIAVKSGKNLGGDLPPRYATTRFRTTAGFAATKVIESSE